MIKKVRFENFKCLQQATVKLGALTVLVGANGAGKSSLLQGMELLSLAATAHGADRSNSMMRFGPLFSDRIAPARLSSGMARPAQIVLESTLENKQRCSLRITVPAFVPGTLESEQPYRYELSIQGPDGNPTFVLSAPHDNDPGAHQAAVRESTNLLQLPFQNVIYLRLVPEVMQATSACPDEVPRLRQDGGYLASVLAWLKGAEEEKLERITRDLASVVPGIKRIRTFRAPVTKRENRAFRSLGADGAMGDRFELDFENGKSVPADLLSEGTVLALGLLTKIHEAESAAVTLLLDDIERGLHLEAQYQLVGVLRRLGGTHKGLQIVCSTHSPHLLSLVTPSEVRVMGLDSDRHSHVRSLDMHPEFEKWKFGTQTGELWAALGESWVTGESAAQTAS